MTVPSPKETYNWTQHLYGNSYKTVTVHQRSCDLSTFIIPNYIKDSAIYVLHDSLSKTALAISQQSPEAPRKIKGLRDMKSPIHLHFKLSESWGTLSISHHWLDISNQLLGILMTTSYLKERCGWVENFIQEYTSDILSFNHFYHTNSHEWQQTEGQLWPTIKGHTSSTLTVPGDLQRNQRPPRRGHPYPI